LARIQQSKPNPGAVQCNEKAPRDGAGLVGMAKPISRHRREAWGAAGARGGGNIGFEMVMVVAFEMASYSRAGDRPAAGS
jgi:hypothetical protein